VPGEVKRRGWRCYVTLTALRNVLAVCGWEKGVDYPPSSISACRPTQPRDPAQHTYVWVTAVQPVPVPLYPNVTKPGTRTGRGCVYRHAEHVARTRNP